MAQKLVAGNWKMHLRLEEARELFAGIVDGASEFPEDVKVLVIPPFPFIHPLNRELAPDSQVELGAQDCHYQQEGAFTGEVSPSMLRSAGAKYCIVGHSERRRDFGEDEAIVLAKTRAAMEEGLKPILCLGEGLEEREQERAGERIDEQLKGSLLRMSQEEGEQCIVAYEPIWAIGTGHTASPEQAQEMHAHIRQRIREEWGEGSASRISLLYGGSCKASNAEELFAQEDVDGGLIGGASLKSEEFASIIRSFP